MPPRPTLRPVALLPTVCGAAQTTPTLFASPHIVHQMHVPYADAKMLCRSTQSGRLDLSTIESPPPPLPLLLSLAAPPPRESVADSPNNIDRTVLSQLIPDRAAGMVHPAGAPCFVHPLLICPTMPEVSPPTRVLDWRSLQRESRERRTSTTHWPFSTHTRASPLFDR